MVYGLGHTIAEKTFFNLRQFPFSLNVDEGTCSSNKKVLAMLIRYFHEEQNDVIEHSHHSHHLEVMKVNAASLEKVMSNFFQEKQIPWSNLVSIMLDSCNVIRGSKSGLETQIRQKYCPTLHDVAGDSCHHVHNAAKKFAGPFENYLEGLFMDLHTDHQWASDQVFENPLYIYKKAQRRISFIHQDLCKKGIIYGYVDYCFASSLMEMHFEFFCSSEGMTDLGKKRKA